MTRSTTTCASSGPGSVTRIARTAAKPITGQTQEQITDQLMTMEEGKRFMVMAPVVRGRKGEYGKLFDQFRADGYSRVEGRRRDADAGRRSSSTKYKHDISVVVDRLVMKPDLRRRLSGESVEAAASLAEGLVEIEVIDGERQTFSESFACLECGTSMPELEPPSSPSTHPGACPACTGLG